MQPNELNNNEVSSDLPESLPRQTADIENQFLHPEGTGHIVAVQSQPLNTTYDSSITPAISTSSIPETTIPKKNRILFCIFMLLSVAQIIWLGTLAWDAVNALNTSRLIIWLSCAMLACIISIQFIYLYRRNGFKFTSRKKLFFACLSVIPVVTYIVCTALMWAAIKFKFFSLGLGLLSGIVFAGQIAFYALPISTIGLDVIINKRSKLKKVLCLWPISIMFIAGIIAVMLVGSPNSSQTGIAEHAQLEKVKTDTTAYLADKYGMQFQVQDIHFDKEETQNNLSKRVVVTVSPMKDPSFSYSGSVYLNKDIDLASGTLKDRVRYNEDFLGEYWKYGFAKNVCPSTQSTNTTFTINTCTVTNYSLNEDYNKVIARYKGNLPAYSELSENERMSVKFSLTIESSDENNLVNALEHVRLLEAIRTSINQTGSVGNITYYANPIDEKKPRLGYYGTSDMTTPGGKIPIENLMFEQNSAEEKKHPSIYNVLYYNPETGKFDLPKPR